MGGGEHTSHRFQRIHYEKLILLSYEDILFIFDLTLFAFIEYVCGIFVPTV